MNITGFEGTIVIDEQNIPVVDVYLVKPDEITSVNGNPVKSSEFVGVVHKWTSLGRDQFNRYTVEYAK